MKVCAFQLRPHFNISNHHHHLQLPKLLLPATILSTTTTTTTTTKKKINRHSLQKLSISIKSPATKNKENELLDTDISKELPRWVVVGGLSLVLALHILGFEGQQEAMAFVPNGPLVEEFWDNVRRYGLYFITVSTGAIYSILLPIYELLKNPITAILIIIVFVGTLYLLSQVLSAMVGISDFSYQYGY